jgi:hypothetical protein
MKLFTGTVGKRYKYVLTIEPADERGTRDEFGVYHESTRHKAVLTIVFKKTNSVADMYEREFEAKFPTSGVLTEDEIKSIRLNMRDTAVPDYYR